MIVKHIHKEGNREIAETLDLRDCNQPYSYTDKITIGKEGNHTFCITDSDFELLYQMKIRNELNLK